MKQGSYPEQDFVFGQLMLTLRSATGLTQLGLANLLGISRQAVADWEAGRKYPKVEHLKSFIVIAIEHQAFHAGHEAEEIHTLWKSSRQKVLLEEAWLTHLLVPQPDEKTGRIPQTSPANGPHVDWGDAIAVPTFYGREWELNLLTEWIVEERCRVVSVLGLGGIGKSALAVSLMYRIAPHFDAVIWRSLRDNPTCEMLLDDLLQVLSPRMLGEVSASIERRLSLLLENLRTARVLLVLDNLESVLEEGEGSGRMRTGYEDMGRFLRQCAETAHQSSVLLTSREKPGDLVRQEGSRAPVRTLRLARLEAAACEALLLEKDVIGTISECARLIEIYGGNPLALKIATQTIVELFDGDISPFLEQGETIFGGIRELLDEQFNRLSAVEQSVLLWLAILREPATLDELLAVSIKPSRAPLLEAVETLNNRSLIERGQQRGSFTLQSVVMEYMTAHLIAEASEEIQQGKLARLVEHGLELAQSREYVRQTQERLIIAPILAQLRSIPRRQELPEQYLLDMLKLLASWSDGTQGYGPANLIVMLRLLRGNLRGVDLSHLRLRSVYLQSVDMQDASLSDALIQDSVFTETFDAMTAVSISSAGTYWAASSRRGEIRVWKAEGRLLHQAWRGHTDIIWSLTFSPDEHMLATGSWDGTVKVWNVADGMLVWSGKYTSHITRVAFSPDGKLLASAGTDATVCLWDSRSGVLLETLSHPGSVAVVIWSPDGWLIASGDAEGYIRLWARSQSISEAVPMLLKHGFHVDGLAFAPDGRTLASGDWDSTVKLWEVATGRLLQTLTGHTGRVARLAWSADGRILASSSSDQTILLWDVEQNSYRAMLKGHLEDVYDVAFTPKGRNLLSSSRDGTLRVWDVESGQCTRVIYGYAASIYQMDWSPNSAQLVSGGSDMQVTLWDLSGKAALRTLLGHDGVVCSVSWSSGGRWLASSDSEHAVRLWDLAAGGSVEILRPADYSGDYYYGLAWSPDGQRLASGTNQGGITVWDVVAHTEQNIGHQFSLRLPQVAWSPDGRHLAGGGVDGIVYIWNVKDNSLEKQLIGHHSMIRSLAWSPDGRQIASGSGGSQGAELFIWDVQREERMHNLVGHSGIVLALAYSSYENVLISGSDDGVLRCWDVQRGVSLWVRDAHQGSIYSIRRSPDGTRLASCGDDGAIMLWELLSGEYLLTLRHDRPYERLNITRIRGLTEAQKATLRDLGAIEDD